LTPGVPRGSSPEYRAIRRPSRLHHCSRSHRSWNFPVLQSIGGTDGSSLVGVHCSLLDLGPKAGPRGFSNRPQSEAFASNSSSPGLRFSFSVFRRVLPRLARFRTTSPSPTSAPKSGCQPVPAASDEPSMAPLVRFFAPSALETRRVHLHGIATSRFVPPSGFLGLLAVYSSPYPPTLFHAGNTPGVFPSELGTFDPATLLSEELPSCGWSTPWVRRPPETLSTTGL
jgi:hypothetical protein